MESVPMPPWLLQMLKRDCHWLEKQPGMNPWKKGCAVIGQHLNTYLHEYTKAHCAGPISADHADYPTYIQRIWSSWSHHWQQAAGDGCVEGEKVAEQIRQGRGYTGTGRLGGDPLRDVVIAEAVARKDPAAIVCFEREYRSYSVGRAVTKNSRVANDPDDWWYSFLDKLGGYSKPPGKLAKFHGYCGLKNWLGTVARRYALRYPPPPLPTFGDGAEEPTVTPSPTPLGEDASVGTLAEVLRDALSRLLPSQRLILYLRFAESLPNKEVARRLGIHPGGVTNRERIAIARLTNTVSEIAETYPDENAYQESRRAVSELANLRQLVYAFCGEICEMVQDDNRASEEKEARR